MQTYPRVNPVSTFWFGFKLADCYWLCPLPSDFDAQSSYTCMCTWTCTCTCTFTWNICAISSISTIILAVGCNDWFLEDEPAITFLD